MSAPRPDTGALMDDLRRDAPIRGRRQRNLRVARTLVAAAAVIVTASLLGSGAAVAVAVATAHPVAFLTAGALATFAVAVAGFNVTWRSLPRGRRLLSSAAAAGALLVAGAGALLIPLADSRMPPASVPGQAFWQLSTGSHIAYLHLPAVGPPQPFPVVVLHGGPGLADMAGDTAFFGQLTALGFDVYVYDQLGAGRSNRLADPAGYGIDRDAADLEAIRQTIGAERMVLIGHSYGGTLAGHYLAAHPDRVENLILSSPGPLDPADTSGDLARARLDTGQTLRTYLAVLPPRTLLGYALLQVNPAAAHSYLPDGEADARNDRVLSLTQPALHCTGTATAPIRGSGFYALQYPQSATAPPGTDLRPSLAGLATPTLIIKGSCDYLSWRSAIDYRTALPNATLLYIPGAGHNTYQDQPAAVISAVQSLLTGTPQPQSPYTADTPPPDYQGPP